MKIFDHIKFRICKLSYIKYVSVETNRIKINLFIRAQVSCIKYHWKYLLGVSGNDRLMQVGRKSSVRPVGTSITSGLLTAPVWFYDSMKTVLALSLSIYFYIFKPKFSKNRSSFLLTQFFYHLTHLWHVELKWYNYLHFIQSCLYKIRNLWKHMKGSTA